MKFIIAIFLSVLVVCTTAFNLHSTRYTNGLLQMKQNTGVSKWTAGIVAAGLTLGNFGNVMPANAEGVFFERKTYSEVLAPKDAELVEDVANNENVKAGKTALKNYISIAQSLCQDLKQDAQLDVRSRLKELGSADVRTNLNKFNEAFSEDTQRGTDRLIRVALQDITELKKDSVVKDGKQRSDIKRDILVKKLDSVSKALTDLAAFYP